MKIFGVRHSIAFLLALSAWAAHAAPQRIVSLLPSLTESVCELGACSRLVGVDRYSNWPTSVQQLPRVGGGIDPNIEAIVALKPDLVLMAESTRAAERLQALGLKVLMLERGAEHKHITDYKTATKMPWEFEHRGKTTQQQKEKYFFHRYIRSITAAYP